MLYIYIVGVCILMSSMLQGILSVRILNIRVPEVIQYGTKDSAILDCDFEAENTTGLVLKWFFMDKSRPVYQWIYKQKPQALGLLRGRVDLSYKASRASHKMYRAMRILNPGTELTGDYTCVVSTFLDEDEETKPMTIFVPERKFHFIQDKLPGDLLNVICSVEAMYPEPSITIRAFKRELNNVRTSVRKIDGLYSAVASSMLSAHDLASPTEFVCEVQICQANYLSMRKAIYYEGFFDTTTCEQPNAADMQTSLSSSICK